MSSILPSESMKPLADTTHEAIEGQILELRRIMERLMAQSSRDSLLRVGRCSHILDSRQLREVLGLTLFESLQIHIRSAGPHSQ
eukprot:CAMPEP_0197865322 /NCGR_PEP_ID=MMETSP1438-20131217/43601_1 /TAXON_ID=1461541 /ORGANISM="Pterosperma sp., Strain CCMP1384" /LENGTH=83 /DNA_ID=CAMNT_0043483773 /DNA_START=409 /DNA_END=660 /DNA_ORIENTATION=-